MGSDSRRLKVVIPGGTGQLGSILARAFHGDGHEVVVLSRNPTVALWRVVAWDARTLGDWAGEVEGTDVVVNLAGRTVNCRYTPGNRRLIRESRVVSTRIVGEAIARATRPPRAWFQAGTATIYSHRLDAPNDELTGILGGSEPDAPDTWRFSVEMATAWERAMDEFEVPHTRKVVLRSAMTMSPDTGGVFDALLGLVRRGLGGRSGDGGQYVSWVHDADFIRAIYWLIENEEVAGPVNIASPEPLPNGEFMRDLREAAGIPFGLPAAGWLLEVGATLMGTETELILKSRRVVPGRLLAGDFRFRFPTWREAAGDLCRRWRERRRVEAGRDRGGR